MAESIHMGNLTREQVERIETMLRNMTCDLYAVAAMLQKKVLPMSSDDEGGAKPVPTSDTHPLDTVRRIGKAAARMAKRPLTNK